MTTDSLSGSFTAGSPRAADAFERAVWNVLSHRPDGAAALSDALAEAPDFAAALALRGFCKVLLARRETMEAARADHALAQAATAIQATASERALVEALGEAVAGRWRKAAARLDAHTADRPHDILAFKLSHALRFMSGDAAGMLKASAALLPRWSASRPGHGFLLGAHAFALEENGFLQEAERAGRDALEIEPNDAWGAHAVGHVYEMTCRPAAGARWLEATRPMWSGCNNFAFHMAWHLALHKLEEDRADLALEIYDSHVRPASTDDFRDVANAVSLLWRLRQHGTPTGDRWLELAAIARARASDRTLVFASLHHVLTAIAVGDEATLMQIVAELACAAQASRGDQAQAARIGADVARALVGAARGSGVPADVDAGALGVLGGSRAQRDVFVRTMVLAAAEDGDMQTFERIAGARGKSGADRFETLARSRLAQAAKNRKVA